MRTKFFIAIFGTIAIFTIFGITREHSSNQISKLEEDLQINTLKKIPLPASKKGDTDEKKVEILQEVKEPELVEVPEGLSFKPSDPYQELRSRGAENARSDSASYIDSTIKLVKNVDQDQEEDRVVQAEANNPYTELKENNQAVPEANTLKYIESTTSLPPDS